METSTSSIESLFEKTESYGKTTFELAKLQTLETTVQVAASLISNLGVIIMFSLFVLVLTIAIAMLLGELLGKSYYGFFVVAAFYLLAAAILHFFLHRWIKKPVADLIIRQALQ